MRVAASAAILTAGVAVSADTRTNDLSFTVVEGHNLNSFVRAGPVAAHLLLRSGTAARILVAFPAGNSGVGIWFEPAAKAATWQLLGTPQPVTLHDARGRPLYGISAEAEIDAPALTVQRALLTSVRVLRDYQAIGRAPGEVLVDPVTTADRLTWSRDRLDGQPGYRLSLTVAGGRLDGGRLLAGTDGRIRLRIVAASGEPPLTPLGGTALLNARAMPDIMAQRTLAFLSYREKFLAGSWRFDTYFGRDTLMSVRLLMPVLQPESVESGLRSVVARLSRQGEVAHEEGIGEFAVLANRARPAAASGSTGHAADAPELDYGMINSSYLLAPVAATWLLDDPRGAARARAFLAASSQRADGGSETVGAALVRNLLLVTAQTRGFADHPDAAHLLAIKPGRASGQWRDSDTGLGGGKYPFDVNAVFAPAALTAADRLLARGLLDPYLTPASRAALADAGRAAAIWTARAHGYFEVGVPASQARRAIEAYAAALQLPAAAALASVVHDDPARFDALALNADGSPVKVINSDAGFDLLFGSPAPARLQVEVAAMMRPFPAGLMTNIGLLVANPVYAPAATQALFTPAKYHGLVVWSWQQAVLAAGLDRQLQRTDLPAPLRTELTEARAQLWQAITATRAVANSELWSWRFADGRYQVVPFGAGQQDVDELNAAQLWSTVFLALRPPPGS